MKESGTTARVPCWIMEPLRGLTLNKTTNELWMTHRSRYRKLVGRSARLRIADL